MKGPEAPAVHRLVLTLAACGLTSAASLAAAPTTAEPADSSFDPLLSAGATLCGPAAKGPPALVRAFILAKNETSPFQPAP